MKRRKTLDRYDEFQRLVRQAQRQRSAYLGEAIAGATAAMWNGFERASAALRSRFHVRPHATRRSLASG